MPELSKDVPVVAFLPATLIPDPTFDNASLEQIAKMTLDPPLIRCERSADGKLRLYPPTSGAVVLMLEKINMALSSWVAKNDNPGYPFTRKRFFLRGGVVLCPDIAFIGEYFRDAPGPDLTEPLRVCPDFVIEICPNPRQFRPLMDKMLQWIASGVGEGWLIVPQLETVFVHTPGMTPQECNEQLIFASIPLDGFCLNLDDIWRLSPHRQRK